LVSVTVEALSAAGAIFSEKMALTLVSRRTPVAPSAGVVLSTVGAVASTVQVWLAGLLSVLPAASVTRTSKVYSPSVRLAYSLGEEQALNEPGVSPCLVSLHSKVELSSEEEKAKLAEDVLTPDGAESMLVFGAQVSTVQVWLAGVGSVLPETSVARTWKVCCPSRRKG